MLNFSYPKRTGEQGVQGEQGNKGNRENSEKKGTEDAGKQGEQGNRGTRDQGEQGKNNICTHNLWRDKGQIGLRLSLGNKNNQVKELYLLMVKFLCDDTKQHNTIVFLMQSSMTSFIASFKMLQDTEHYVIFLPYVLLHVLVAYFFARCFDGCLISIH